MDAATQEDKPGKLSQVQVLSNLKVANGRSNARGVITSSYDGSLIAVTWPAVKQYVLYRQGATSWEE